MIPATFLSHPISDDTDSRQPILLLCGTKYDASIWKRFHHSWRTSDWTSTTAIIGWAVPSNGASTMFGVLPEILRYFQQRLTFQTLTQPAVLMRQRRRHLLCMTTDEDIVSSL